MVLNRRTAIRRFTTCSRVRMVVEKWCRRLACWTFTRKLSEHLRLNEDLHSNEVLRIEGDTAAGRALRQMNDYRMNRLSEWGLIELAPSPGDYYRYLAEFKGS